MLLVNRVILTALLALIFVSNLAVATEIQTKKNVMITNAWVRSTNPGQAVGAAYMTLIAKQNATLMRVESDVSASVEMHSMNMANGVMKMRMLENLKLTANKPYSLTPGGFHMMLFNLKKPLNVGDNVRVTLYFKTKLTQFKQTIIVPVKSIEEVNVIDSVKTR